MASALLKVRSRLKCCEMIVLRRTGQQGRVELVNRVELNGRVERWQFDSSNN